MVISCATPCIQGFSDPVEAEQWATTVNNRLAESIANNTDRFGGFASLSMHNATNAALELKRTVEELGFLGMRRCLLKLVECLTQNKGALLNDYQQAGPDNGRFILTFFNPRGFTDPVTSHSSLLRPARVRHLLANGLRS